MSYDVFFFFFLNKFCLSKNGKQEKRKKILFTSIFSSFPTMFSKAFLLRVLNM